MVDALASEGARVQLSLDGPPEVHDRYRPARGGGSSHAAAIRALSLLRQRPEVAVRGRATICGTDIPLAARVRYFAALGFGTVEFTFAADNARSGVSMSEADLAPYREEADELVATIVRARLRGLVLEPFEGHAKSIAQGTYRQFVCGAGSSALSVAPDGGLYPCHRLHGDPDSRLGDVGEGGLDETRRRLFVGLNADDLPECSACWAVRLCGGCCPGESAAFGRPPGRPGPSWCAAKQLEAEIGLKLAVATGRTGA
jgi:uncharacterized protein